MATGAEGALQRAVNAVIAAAPGIWLYYCYNAEYLFYPFSESRTIGEMLTFQTEERRDAVLSYVIDLYAGDLDEFPNAVAWKTRIWTARAITRWRGPIPTTTCIRRSGS